MNCKTCKHWTPFQPRHSSYSSHDELPTVQELNELGLCNRINGVNSHYEDTYDEEDLFDGQCAQEGVLAALEDLSDHAFLRCNADFGCILHEKVGGE